MKRSYGFTLIELMITVAVVAILAAIALPSYADYVRRGNIARGLEALSEAKVRMEQGYASSRTYQTGAACALDLSGLFTQTDFTLTSTCPSSTTFTLSISGRAGTNVAGFTYTINEAGTRATPNTPTGLGYPTSTTCWIRAKGTTC